MSFTSQLLLQSLGLADEVFNWNLVHEGRRVGFWFLLHKCWEERERMVIRLFVKNRPLWCSSCTGDFSLYSSSLAQPKGIITPE